MAYPVRNYEPNASKRKPGWYRVPGKGRRYWTGKKWTFGKGDPEGRTNVTGRLRDAISRTLGGGSAKASSKRSRPVSEQEKKNQADRRRLRNDPEAFFGTGTKKEDKKPQTSSSGGGGGGGGGSSRPAPKPKSDKNAGYKAARDKIKKAKGKEEKAKATTNAEIVGLKAFIKAHKDKKGMAKAVEKARASLAKKEGASTKSKSSKPFGSGAVYGSSKTKHNTNIA